mmetsp:Transcript_78675/g.218470  ORF Transcript_78675/g.218470 Transcript_78675/m.218470 type:complete len:232 (+) Transcript_78675:1019-1714(+)
MFRKGLHTAASHILLLLSRGIQLQAAELECTQQLGDVEKFHRHVDIRGLFPEAVSCRADDVDGEVVLVKTKCCNHKLAQRLEHHFPDLQVIFRRAHPFRICLDLARHAFRVRPRSHASKIQMATKKFSRACKLSLLPGHLAAWSSTASPLPCGKGLNGKEVFAIDDLHLQIATAVLKFHFPVAVSRTSPQGTTPPVQVRCILEAVYTHQHTRGQDLRGTRQSVRSTCLLTH